MAVIGGWRWRVGAVRGDLVLVMVLVFSADCWGATIYGRVLDRQSDAALAGVTVVTLPPSQVVCTDGQGRYRITNARAHRSYAVYAGKNGYRINHATIRTRDGGSRTQADIAIEPESRITGLPACSPNRNLPDVGETGIMGAVYATGYAWKRNNPSTPAALWDLDQRDYSAYSIEEWTIPVSGTVVQTRPASERVVTDAFGHFVIDKVKPGRSYELQITKPGYVVVSNSPRITARDGLLLQAGMVMGPRLARPVFTQKDNARFSGYVDLGIKDPSPWANYIDSFVDGKLQHVNTHIHEAPRFVTKDTVLKAQARGRRGLYEDSPVATIRVRVVPITSAYAPTFRLRSAQIARRDSDNRVWDQMGMGFQNRPDTYAEVAVKEQGRWRPIVKTKVRKNTFDPYWDARTTTKAERGSQFRVRVFEASGDQRPVRPLGSTVVTIKPADLKRGYVVVPRFGSVAKLIITLKNPKMLATPATPKPRLPRPGRPVRLPKARRPEKKRDSR